MGRDTAALRKRRKVKMYWCTTRGNYTEIEGDPLYVPTAIRVWKRVRWDENGMPDYSVPPAITI